MFRCFINIQKDANERKLTHAGRTNVAIYMCTKFAVRFVYVDTNKFVRSWQILYVNQVLWYVNGNAVCPCIFWVKISADDIFLFFPENRIWYFVHFKVLYAELA